MMERMLSLIRHHPSPADLSARADGTPAGDARQRIDTHLQRCARCRGRLQELATVRALLSDLPPVTAPRSFRLSPASVRPAEPPVRRGYPVLQLASALAAVAFLLLVGGDVVTSVGLPGDGGGGSPAGVRVLQSAPPTSTDLYAGIAVTPEKSGAEAPAAGEAAPSPSAAYAMAPQPSAPGTLTPGLTVNGAAAGTPSSAQADAAAAPPAPTPPALTFDQATPPAEDARKAMNQAATPGAPSATAAGQPAAGGALPGPSSTPPLPGVEPQAAPERLDKGRTALRAAEALVGLVALAGVTGTVLRRRRTG